MNDESGSPPAELPPAAEPWTEADVHEVPHQPRTSMEGGGQRVAFGINHRLDPAHVPASRLSGWIVIASLGSGALIGLTILAFNVDWPLLALIGTGLGAVLVLFLLIWLNLAWPPLELRRTSWRIDAQGIEIRRGVVWRHVVNVPRARVQHTDVTQGPVQRRYGLATLVIHTAGTHEYEVTLEGLAHPTALLVRDELLDSDGEDGA